jgi:hypothetical protein
MAALPAALLLALPGYGHAQVAWDTPLLVAPAPPAGFGIYLLNTHGGDVGVMGAWRASYWNFQVRGGLAEGSGPDEDLAVFGGVDYSGRVTRDTQEFPLDIDWVVGAGASIGDGAVLSFPAGLTIGHTFLAENARFTPYITPRVVLDAFLDTDRGRDGDVELDFATDLGLDFRINNSVMFRFGATIGDREGVAIGVVF